MERQITHEQIATVSTDTSRNAMYHAFPGIVQAFHAGSSGKRATVDVQIAVNDVRIDVDTDDLISEPFDVILDVPLVTWTFGQFVIGGPVAVGGEVTMLAFDLDPTSFRQTGNRSDPPMITRHGGLHWLALPGGISDPKAPQSSALQGSSLVIGVDGGQPLIVINGSTIQLGGTGGDAVALASVVDGVFSALVELAGALPPTTPITGAALKALLQAAWGGSASPGTPPTTTASPLVTTNGPTP
jgi:hypothetical protein